MEAKTWQETVIKPHELGLAIIKRPELPMGQAISIEQAEISFTLGKAGGKKDGKLTTLRELRDMWAYEQAAGSAVMAIRLEKWAEYCKKAGITDDWWELKEE